LSGQKISYNGTIAIAHWPLQNAPEGTVFGLKSWLTFVINIKAAN